MTYPQSIQRLLPLFVLLVGGRIGAETRATLDLADSPKHRETLVWSPIFQGAWDLLEAQNGGPSDKINPPNPLIEKLEDFEWDENKVLPEGGTRFLVGPNTQRFVQQIRGELSDQFGDSASRAVQDGAGRGDELLVYGFLQRKLIFEKRFFRAPGKDLKFHDGKKRSEGLPFFGTKGAASGLYGDSVKVLLHETEPVRTFALEVVCKRKGEKLILWLPPQNLALDQAIKAVRLLKEPGGIGEDGRLAPKDFVAIPFIKLRDNTDFTDSLQGIRQIPGNPVPRKIAEAKQISVLQVDEEGAVVQVEARIEDEPFGPDPTPVPKLKPAQPRQFVYDWPFWMFFWRDGAEYPYLAAWIGSEEVLLKE